MACPIYTIIHNRRIRKYVTWHFTTIYALDLIILQKRSITENHHKRQMSGIVIYMYMWSYFRYCLKIAMLVIIR